MKFSSITLLIIVSVAVGSFIIFYQRADIIPASVDANIVVKDAQAFVMPVSQVAYFPIRDFTITEPEILARSAVLIDGKSGRILYAKNPDTRQPIASITKIMTAVIVIENMDLYADYTVSAEDLNVDGDGADFLPSEKLVGGELMKMMLVKSSNDAASVFATTAYREGKDFVNLMNKKAAELGMTSTKFGDPAGLDDVETYSSALDVAKLVKYAMRYDAIKTVVTEQEADVLTLSGAIYHIINTNQLLSSIPHIIFGKTGNTTGALGTLTLAVDVDSPNGDYIISVVLGANDRFFETKKLVDWGLKAHKWN